MKKLLAVAVLILTALSTFGQGVRIQAFTTNSGPVVTNIVLSLSSNLQPNRLRGTNSLTGAVRVWAATSGTNGFWLDPATITPGAATNVAWPVQGSNTVLTTNGFEVTINSITDTNVVNTLASNIIGGSFISAANGTGYNTSLTNLLATTNAAGLQPALLVNGDSTFWGDITTEGVGSISSVAFYGGSFSGIGNLLTALQADNISGGVLHPARMATNTPFAGAFLEATSPSTAAWSKDGSTLTNITGNAGGATNLLNASGEVVIYGNSMEMRDPNTGWTNVNWSDQTLSTQNTNVLDWFNQRLIGPWLADSISGNGAGLTNINSFTNAQTYWVDLNGSDSNPGTVLLPFRTVTNAIARGGNGARIQIGAGTFVSPPIVTLYGQTLIGASDGTTRLLGTNQSFFYITNEVTVKNLTIELTNRTGSLDYPVTANSWATNVVFEDCSILGVSDCLLFQTASCVVSVDLFSCRLRSEYDAVNINQPVTPDEFEPILSVASNSIVRLFGCDVECRYAGTAFTGYAGEVRSLLSLNSKIEVYGGRVASIDSPTNGAALRLKGPYGTLYAANANIIATSTNGQVCAVTNDSTGVVTIAGPTVPRQTIGGAITILDEVFWGTNSINSGGGITNRSTPVVIGADSLGVGKTSFQNDGTSSFASGDVIISSVGDFTFSDAADLLKFASSATIGTFDDVDGVLKFADWSAVRLDGAGQYIGNGSGLTNIQEEALVYPAANPAAGLVLTSTSSNTAAWLAPTGGGGSFDGTWTNLTSFDSMIMASYGGYPGISNYYVWVPGFTNLVLNLYNALATTNYILGLFEINPQYIRSSAPFRGDFDGDFDGNGAGLTNLNPAAIVTNTPAANQVVQFTSATTAKATGDLTVASITGDAFGNGYGLTNIISTNIVNVFKFITYTNYTVVPTDQIIQGNGTNQLVTLPDGTNGLPNGTIFTFGLRRTDAYRSMIITNANGYQSILSSGTLSQTITNGQSLTVIWDGEGWL